MSRTLIDVSQDGIITTRVQIPIPATMKSSPKINIKFTNQIPEQYEESKGCITELEGSYDAIISLIRELIKAIEQFKSEELEQQLKEAKG